jgi:amino acid adenylation domain-containing protein
MDRPRPLARAYRGSHRPFALPPALVASLDALARRHQVTPFILLLAVFQVLLHRLSGQRHVNVGVPVAGRDRVEVEGLIGFFVNTLVLSSDQAGDPEFKDFLTLTCRATVGAFAHQDLPFERLVNEIHPQRDLRTTPVFQVTFTFQQDETQAIEALPGLELVPMEAESRTAKYDFDLELRWRDGQLSGAIEYDVELFDRSTVDRLLGSFRRLLAGVVEAPARRLGELPLLSPAERHQLVVGWNDSALSTPAERAVGELFEAQARRTPARVAAVFGASQLTYGELARRVDRLAGHLAARGLGCEGVVALFAPRGIDYLTAMLAILRAGAVYLPLDPFHPLERLADILRNSGTRAALASTRLRDRLSRAVALLPEGRPGILDLDELLATDGAAPPPDGTPPEALAYVIYTSGSTGVPKGAMIDRRGLVNHLYAKIEDLRLGPADTVAQNAAQTFDISIWQSLSALLVGGRVDVFDDETALDPSRLLDRLATGAVSVLQTVPSLLRVLQEEVERRGDARPSLLALRLMIPNGEVLPPELCRRWLAAYPQAELVNCYGLTEVSDDVTHQWITTAPRSETSIPLGHLLPNLRIYVVDRALRPVAAGVAGELLVAGIGVGRGYLGDRVKTARTFVPDPFPGRRGGRLYRTGDQVRWRPSGDLEFLGRFDSQIKIRGLRVELGEIESALTRHPAVRQTVVLTLDGAASDPYLCAYVVADGEVEITALKRHLARSLPEYMIPSRFVLLDEMPLNTSGKVDRGALPAPASTGESEVEFEAPRTALERTLATIWEEVLDLERVGIGANFFDLGGHSLAAIRTAARIGEELSMEFPVRTLFLQPTIRELSASLAAVRTVAEASDAVEDRIRELRLRIADLKAQQPEAEG